MVLHEALGIIEQLKKENALLRRQLQYQSKQLQKLQERLNKNSTNSSKPPSSDGPEVQRPPKASTGRQRGAQPGHAGAHRARKPLHQVDRLQREKIQGPCPHCACNEMKQLQWRFVKQVWELPEIRPTVTEYQVQTGICCKCQAKREASLPSNTPKGCFGATAQAAVATLTGCSSVSRRKARFLFEHLLGLPLSLGTVSAIEQRVSNSLHKPAKQVRAALRTQPLVHVDETGHKRAGLRRWNWVMCNKQLAGYRVGQRRSKAVAQQLLGKNFKGSVVSDNYSAYRFIPSQQRQLCLAHVLRSLKGMSQRGSQLGEICKKLVCDLQTLFRLHRRLKGNHALFQQDAGAVRTELTDTVLGAFLEHKELRPLGRILFSRSAEVWNFMDHPLLPMTNNQAERDIRPLVVWRKISHGTQSIRGDRYMERIQTVNQTCQKQNRNPFSFIKNTLIAYWKGSKPPSLLPQPPPRGI